ncbi:MAG: hypothetical protein H0T73_07975 [Ardenticatenales bacterium]|nr:hypothetical protein [Ardenticatenales bacterium]
MAHTTTCQSCGALDQEVGKFCEQCGTRVEDQVSAVPAGDAGASTVDAGTPPADSADAGLDDILGPSADPILDPSADAGLDAPVDAGATPPVAGDNGGTTPTTGDTSATPPATGDAGATPIATVPVDKNATMRFIRLENGVLNRDHVFDVPLGSRLLLGRTDPANGVFPEVDLTMWSQRVVTPDGALYTIHRRQCYISRDDQGVVWVVDCPEYVGDTMVSPVGTAQFRTIPALAGERESNDEGSIRLEVGDRILMGQGEGMLIFQLMQV